MSTRKRSPAFDSGHFHAVRFYKDSRTLCEIVGKFLAEGFHANQPGVVIATPEHRQHIEHCLRERGFDPAALQQQGALTMHDAAETLAQFMVDGMPESAIFRRTVEPMLRAACDRRINCTVHAYGEMVNVLWQAGQSTAAIRLETLWNSLARTSKFSLLCGYAMGNFYKGTDVEWICKQHSHVITEDVRDPDHGLH
jgi:hypothetical protein